MSESTETTPTLNEERILEIINKYYAPIVTGMKNLITAQRDLIIEMFSKGTFAVETALNIATMNSKVIRCAEALKSLGEKKKEIEK